MVGVLVGGGPGRRVQHGQRDRGGDHREGGPDEVGEVVAGVERRGGRIAVGEQAVRTLGRERREQERQADLDTVRTEMCRRLAICAFDRSSPSAVRTSASRSESSTGQPELTRTG